MKQLRYYLAFLTVRPRRWFFRRCISYGCGDTIWWPRMAEPHDCWHWTYDREKTTWEMIQWPNVHWVMAYRIVFRFFKWLNYKAWRHLCQWNRVRLTYPWYARLVHRIGKTTAGCVISGGECWHCGSEDGDPVELSQDEDGVTFILDRSWQIPTMDGTDYRFCGHTICPKCGYRDYYEDGSL